MKITLETLPLKNINESKDIFKKLISTHKALAELKGVVKSIPNEEIIINTLSLQESKESSEIEQIVTTHDEIFKATEDYTISQEGKEVKDYAKALRYGVSQIKEHNGISNNTLIKIVQIIKSNSAEFRKTNGTHLKNSLGEVIYTPPQNEKEIIYLMNNLEKYTNDNSLDDLDILVKLAIIHHQFESIHPFYDGNGRVGRILNILYLILNKVLDLPILYLSGYIIKTKSEYYKLLQETREQNKWEDWILYILEALEKTSLNTIKTVEAIKILISKQKAIIKEKAPKIYSQDLLNLLFHHPYTKIDFLVEKIGVTRQTASKYLENLENLGVLKMEKKGRIKYYINQELVQLLKDIKY